MSHVLDKETLAMYNAMPKEDLLSFFGKWTNSIENYSHQYATAVPFPNVVIPNFLADNIASDIATQFPTVDDSWHKYQNPIEVKYANDKIQKMPTCVRQIFYALSTDYITNLFSQLSGITDLEYDPCLHGAGLHAHPRYGRLGLHLDYEKHPKLENKERRLNIILYLNQEWDDSWGGATELWNENVTACVKRSPVKFNHAIIFRTNNTSWHGLPVPILCPENVMRKSFAYYYISPIVSAASNDKFGNDGDGYRKKASFIKHPDDPPSEAMDQLYAIRPHRLITADDLNQICPGWDMSQCNP